MSDQSSRYGRSTFRVDFSKTPSKPSQNETVDFLCDVLGICGKASVAQLNTAASSVFITMETEEAALAIVDAHAEKHSLTHEGKKYPVVITMVDESTEVSVRDLPFGIPDKDVATEMAQYGEVLSIKRGIWGPETRLAGVSNGVRIVRMKLRKPIVSFITICGEVTNVTYRGQQQTCRSCALPVHHGLNCVQNRQNRFHNPAQGIASYASTLGSAPTPTPLPATNGTNEAGRKQKNRRPKFTPSTIPPRATASPKATAGKVADRLIVPIVHAAASTVAKPVAGDVASVPAAATTRASTPARAVASATSTPARAAAPTATTASAASVPAADPVAPAHAAGASTVATPPAATQTSTEGTAEAVMNSAEFKTPLDVPPLSAPARSLEEPLAVTRKRNPDNDFESDASSSSTFSLTGVAKRKPGRPRKRATTTLTN